MNGPLSRRGLIGSSAAIGIGAALPGSCFYSTRAFAKGAAQEAIEGLMPGQVNTGTLEYVIGYPTARPPPSSTTRWISNAPAGPTSGPSRRWGGDRLSRRPRVPLNDEVEAVDVDCD